MPECENCGAEFTKRGLSLHQNKCGVGWRKPDLLRELYVEKNLKLREIAGRYDTTDKNVFSWLKKFEIETEKTHRNNEPWKQQEVLEREYVDRGLSQRKIAEKYGVSFGSIRYWMGKHGIEARGNTDYLTETPPKLSTDQSGYEYFTTPDGQVKHHKLVAIAAGEDPARVFDSENHVHHKNNIPWDNRPANVDVLTHSEHMQLTQAARRGEVEYAKQ